MLHKNNVACHIIQQDTKVVLHPHQYVIVPGITSKTIILRNKNMKESVVPTSHIAAQHSPDNGPQSDVSWGGGGVELMGE